MVWITLFTGVCLVSASIPPYNSATSSKTQSPPQQEIEITGQIIDASTGEPLPGVNIIVEGTSIGEITDNEGNYSIKVPSENMVLVFSYVGYTSKSVTLGSQRIINLALTPEVQEIDEVVAIGYGTIKKSDLTGALSSVKHDDFEQVSPDNVLSAIQGRAPGVYISQNTGAPGVEPTIRIRGTGSINAHAPIYVIDGMIMDMSDVRDKSSTINFLNPADIASIEVLKDASATAIYGSRGANGVLLITTQKGFDSRPKASFNAQLGFSKIRNMPDLLRADDYIKYQRSKYGNGYSTSQPDTLPVMRENVILYNDGYDTDWYAEMLKDRPAISQNYNLSVKGGTSDARYSASFGYYNEEGILITNSNYDRYSFRINSDYKLGKYIRLGENLSISQMNRVGIQEASDPIFRSLMRSNPLYPVLKQFDITDPEHPLYANPYDPMYAEPGDPGYDYYKYSEGAGPLASFIYYGNVCDQRLSIFGNIFAEATLLKDFTFRSSLGLNLSNSKTDNFVPAYFISKNDFNFSGTVLRDLYWTNGWLWENILTYHKSLQNHTITVLAGYTSEYNK
jgi:TonB-linked SusC/RagA family outer membrane protein